MSLPVHTRKEYMDRLEDLMATYDEFHDIESPGRPRQLKTYIIECNSNLPLEFSTNDIVGRKKETEVPFISTLDLSFGRFQVSFYLDTADSRFWLLHTGSLSRITERIVRRLVNADKFAFDYTWFPTNMLREIATKPGNFMNGYSINYQDLFLEDQYDAPLGTLRLSIRGNSSHKALDAIKKEKEFRNSLAHTRVLIRRGTRQMHVEDDFTFKGEFIVKEGRSIDDHIALVELAQKRYKEIISQIEELRISVKSVEGRTLIDGSKFDFTFKRKIDDIDKFVEILFSNRFRLWCLKSEVTKNYYQLHSVDLHTGDPFDLEVTPDSIRVYLPERSCGNVILRLLANLQMSFDSNISCETINLN